MRTEQDQWLDRLLTIATLQLVERGEIPAPMLIIGSHNGDAWVYHMRPFADQEAKERQYVLATASIHVLDGKWYALACEGWTITTSPGEIPNMRPSESPQRMEALFLMFISPSVQQMRSYLMHRDGRGKVTSVSELEPPCSNLTGAMADLMSFEWSTADPVERENKTAALRRMWLPFVRQRITPISLEDNDLDRYLIANE